MIRDIPYHFYDKYLGHTLSESEMEELSAKYEECQRNKLLAAKGCCLATCGTFIQEAQYIMDIMTGKDLSRYAKYIK